MTELAPSVFFSPEFLAALAGAFAGALAAFGLAVLQRLWERRNAELDAGLQGLVALAEMYSAAREIREQWIDATKSGVQERQRREPAYFEYGPLAVGPSRTILLSVDRLLYLLRSHDMDLAVRLATVERSFTRLLALVEQRNSLHVRFQERAAATGVRDGGTYNLREVELAIGPDLCRQLRDLTTALVHDVPEIESRIQSAADQLANALAWHFPTARLFRVEPGEQRSTSVPYGRRRPAQWRIAARYLTSRVRGRPMPEIPKPAPITDRAAK